MAAIAQPRPDADAFENRRVRVNGQPGRLLRGPAEQPPGEAERRATARALERVQSGDLGAEQLAELVRKGREGAGDRPAEIRVWSVLTVDVVDGRIEAVRIVRNPDKLAHL
jgi:RNA polymerase sigma-70 factor (ECF subfamily)